MAILLTGGTGKTSARTASLLQKAHVPFLIASRKATSSVGGAPAVRFDWDDPSTFSNPFAHKFPNGETITAVYLVAPPSAADPAPCMNEFVDLARKQGVQRFVLMGGSTTELGGRHVGKVWQHLLDLKVEYCVLRPTWFMENFTEGWNYKTIKDEGKIYTACADGKIPFVSTTDIAAVAFRALMDEKSHDGDHRVLGPELLTYDQIAEKFSSGLGRKIEHVQLSEEDSTKSFQAVGMPEHVAKFLTSLEVMGANGSEERMNDVVEQVTGRKPQTFDAWVQENKSVWI